MRTAAEHSADLHSEGIHWHINPNIKVEYIARDGKRDSVPWVKYTNMETGEVTIYEDEMQPFEEGEMIGLETRTMDCMDCHNRPSHLYNSPTDYVDDGFNKGTIPKDLNFLKQIAMPLLNERYSTLDSSLTAIREGIFNYYKDNEPSIFESKQELIEQAVTGIQEEFKINSFPSMQVYHNSYINHIGHQESKGCFRCHSGTHVSESGKKITNDCNMCHTIVAQSFDTLFQASTVNKPLEFIHPVDIGEAWKEMHCSDCHSALY
jgi:hypothetical protein